MEVILFLLVSLVMSVIGIGLIANAVETINKAREEWRK